jgi:D-arabinose 1-dehydrogenase-like Zn-dependent alcohol dehydrogenase
VRLKSRWRSLLSICSSGGRVCLVRRLVELLETQEMLDFCGKHNLTADVEVIPIQKVNEAYDRLVKADVKYRFAIDMASLKSA